MTKGNFGDKHSSGPSFVKLLASGNFGNILKGHFGNKQAHCLHIAIVRF